MVVEIRYPGVEGDRFINGAKGAINSLTITLCDEGAVEAFIQMIEEARHENVHDDVPGVPENPKKHSIAFIELEPASADGNCESVARLKATATSEADASSPLRNISLRTRQQQGSKEAPVTQDRGSNVAPSASASEKSTEDTPALKLPLEDKPLIERLRASQRRPRDVQSKDKVSSRKSQLGRRNLKADVAEGAMGKGHPPSTASDAAQTQPHSPDPSFPSNKSNYKHNAELANKPTPASSEKVRKFIGVDPGRRVVDQPAESTRKRPRHEITMANLIDVQPDSRGDSEAGKRSARTGLKRRAGKVSTALQNEQSQKPSKFVSKAAEFDLPPSNDEGSRPAKKTKTKNPKASIKPSPRESAKVNRQNVQVAASPKRHKEKAIGTKLTKTLEIKTQKTAASTRARRVTQEPIYIESDDEIEEGGAGEATNAEKSLEHQECNSLEEAAEDSLPLSKGALENALKAPQLNFETNMREIVDGDGTDREDRSIAGAVARDPPGGQTAPKATPVVPSTSHKQTPAKKEKRVSNPPTTKAVSKDTPGLENNGQRKSTPQRNSILLSESPIPPVEEKLLRKTKIVHFGPQGPANQAVQQKSPVTPVRPETTKETSPISQDLDLKQGERVEDIDELVPDHSYEPMLRPPEIKETQPSFSHHGDDILKLSIGGRDADINAYADNADELVIEGYDESTRDIPYDQEASENIVPGAEDAASEVSFQVNDLHSSHKNDTQQYRLHIPLLPDELSPYDAPGAEESQIPGEPTRKSIGTNSTLDQQHPQPQKVVRTSKIRASYRTPEMQEVAISSVATDMVHPVSKGVVEPKNSEEPHGLNHSGLICEGDTTSRILPIPISQTAHADAENVHRQPISARKANLQTGSQTMRKPYTPLSHRVTETMGTPPPPTIPLRSVEQSNPLRKSWPAAKVDLHVIVPQKSPSEPIKPVISGPVRVKKSLSVPISGIEPPLPVLESELPPATPVSFSTRLNLHLPLPATVTANNEGSKAIEGDTSQNVGNGSLTVVNEDETVFGDHSDKVLRLGRRRRSEFGDDSFGTTTPFHRTGEGIRRNDALVGVVSARESQRGVVDAIINITNDVLFRFGAEEDAMKATVNQYGRGGNEIIRTLTSTWDQRLGHERRILGDALKAEKEVLTSALQLVEDGQQSGGAWKETIYDRELTGKVQEKRNSLVRKIEELRNRGGQ
ncbi:uncharacterized protein PV07_09416 [Cladophialophora immunda]|uniref:Uncharacterized protein n=1 Tax=Cladophialophora immunda TaxID=569365 RepID=A0A0D2C727_9EURO|nr:uncharacterized protein PV07_09416 [Cladophialophora immunda]KIW26315.1 hypothetical protein PV07_09416 [Cladophialophora immunda]